MLALVSSLALLAAASPGAGDVPREAGSLEQIGHTIATARVCDSFGYAIDREGLAAWAALQRDALAAGDPALTSDTAQFEIERHVNSSFVRIFNLYWRQGTSPGRTADAFIDAEHRFVHLQRKACERLARSDAVGRFVVPPEQEPGTSEVIDRVRDEYRLLRLES